MNRIKIFIIDDNVMVRYALRQILEQSNLDIDVVGDASDHPGLVEEIQKANPHILLVDIPLPREKGIHRLKLLNKKRLPVIVFTKSDETITKDLVPLLSAGAVSFVLKPNKDEAIDLVKDELITEIKAQVKTKSDTIESEVNYLDPLRVVAIGSSTGGPEALSKILPQIPKNFPAGIVIVQHMPKMFTRSFADRLNNLSAIEVKEAKNGDFIEAGTALLAPGDYHLTFSPKTIGNKIQAKVVLTKDPPQWSLRPTVDKMMTSLAPIYKDKIVGMILTGMGEDGVVGMKSIKSHGGKTLVQNEETSVVFGMAQQVIKNNLADEVWPLEGLVPRICDILKVKI